MKLITVIIIGVLNITSAIRVPTSWSTTNQDLQRNNNNNKFRTNVGSEIYERPYVNRKNNKVRVKYQQKERHHNLERPEAKKEFKPSAALGDWKPIFPVHLIQKDDSFYREFKNENKERVEPSPLYRNYRDDKTHEKPSSSHELPLEIPTKPVYPGEGEWAKRGRKHKPFISKHKFTNPDEHEEEETPEGYEVFEKNRHLFEKQRQKFSQKHLPKEESDYEDEDTDRLEFVPTKLYTQVRRFENEEHLPRLAEDPRLREVIKDSKIQTVYTEEGYEDLAYDHAGHEKNAEEDEGHSTFDQAIEKERQKKARKFKPEDSYTEGSHHHIVKKPLNTKKESFIKTEEVKTASLKDKDDGKTELEILSEIKVMETPNNQTETHKYVTIVPKTFTTETPEVIPLESAIKSVYRIHFRRRNKRFINDFPEIKAETDFIDKINHNLPKIPKKYEKPKYPYYNDPTINLYSPIRYAEDLSNIPEKTEDDLAFYHQADSKVECAEVQSNIDPIPPRVKEINENPENAEGETNPKIGKLPRLRNLGDKIDCFKVKYFGENPLDSPFFQEKDLGPVLPLFKMPKKEYSNDNVGDTRSYSIKIPVKAAVTQEDLNILTDVIEQFNKSEQVESTTTARNTIKLEISDPREDQTEASVISIITTPKYTIDLKPKHIYHQIELLSYLPTYNSSKLEETTTVSSTKSLEETTRSAKSLEETTTVSTPVEEATPESQPLRHRYRQPRPKPPPYQIFDINKYLPANSFSLLNKIIRTSTLVPNHGVASEVHYKHEILPSEQLNVFADVINNIKNSSKNSDLKSSSSNRITVSLNNIDNHRKIPVFETDLDGIEDMTSFYTTSTTIAPRGTIKYSSYNDKEDLFEELANRDRAKYENLELLKINKRLTTTTEPFSTHTRISSFPPVEEEPEEEIEEETTVLGLMPPTPNHYKTIYNPKLVKPVTEETKMNIFYVLGMKPPSSKQKVLLYSDFKIRPHTKSKRPYLRRRGKRSAQRPAYSEVSRNRNKPIDVDDDSEVVVQDDDDDYVPHRPKNYHYDEKTGRIVYDNTKKETEAPEEEYIEVTEAPLPPPTRRNSLSAAPAPKFKNFTGPSFVDFVNKLKSSENYTEITDPPPTEKPEVEDTTTTTAKPISTEPPEFLSILSKVKSSSNYKEIKDKTTKKTTTTEAVLVKVDEVEETQLENVQNSPGGQQIPNFQIFDINDYLPQVKTYTPRTPIDYSKYKTIERPNSGSRHNLSSRYNANEDLESGRTTKTPIEEAKEKEIEITEINPVMSESKHEDVEPSTTTTTTTEATVTRRIRTRPKSRGTRRPTKRVTTLSPSTSASGTEEPVQVNSDKPKRVYPRRRRTRIKVGETTTELPDSEVEESTTGKVIRRRHQKAEETEIASSTEKQIAILNTTKPNLERGKLRKIADVQVFEKYDTRKKHGGNLKKENEEGESKKVDDVKRLTDVVHKPSTYYTDTKLPKKINQLIEVKVDIDQIAEEVENGTEKEELAGDYEYEGLEEKTTTTTTTKKPVFVKDPDKRMYYYAPI